MRLIFVAAPLVSWIRSQKNPRECIGVPISVCNSKLKGQKCSFLATFESATLPPVVHWLRPQPAEMAPFITGADSQEASYSEFPPLILPAHPAGEPKAF